MNETPNDKLEEYEGALKKTITTTIKEIFSIIDTEYIGIKGGFAANQYGLNRLSTDIDIDILKTEKENIIINSIREFLIRTKGKIRAERKLETGYRFVTFTNINNIKTRIQIDLNNKIFNSNKYQQVDLEGTHINIMEKGCVNANKLVSLSERFKDTDLYDVHYILEKNLPIDNDTIKERTGKETKDYIEELINLLNGGYYEATLTAKMPKIFCNKNSIWTDNKDLLNETITLLKQKYNEN